MNNYEMELFDDKSIENLKMNPYECLRFLMMYFYVYNDLEFNVYKALEDPDIDPKVKVDWHPGTLITTIYHFLTDSQVAVPKLVGEEIVVDTNRRPLIESLYETHTSLVNMYYGHESIKNIESQGEMSEKTKMQYDAIRKNIMFTKQLATQLGDTMVKELKKNVPLNLFYDTKQEQEPTPSRKGRKKKSTDKA